jgi:hypothetical protein
MGNGLRNGGGSGLSSGLRNSLASGLGRGLRNASFSGLGRLAIGADAAPTAGMPLRIAKQK